MYVARVHFQVYMYVLLHGFQTFISLRRSFWLSSYFPLKLAILLMLFHVIVETFHAAVVRFFAFGTLHK